MSTWSRMSSARFSKEDTEMSSVGPGSYEIPTAMDEHAVSIAPNGERFVETLEPGGGFYVLDELFSEKKPQAEKRKSRTPSIAAKENRAPSALTPRAEKNIIDPVDSEQLRRRLLDEEKRRAQAEARAADLVVAKKAAANAHAQLQSHERKIEQLQKELEDTTVARKEAHKRACDLEAERGRVKKALYEKEQQSAALQKSLVLAKAQLEERGRKIEEMGSDVEKLRLEAHHLRANRVEDKRPSTTPKKTKEAPSPPRCRFDAEEALRSLEERASAQHAETEGYLQQLAKAQEGLQKKLQDTERQAALELSEAEERLQEQAEELQLRRDQLRYVLTESQRQEDILDAKVLVRDVTLRALVKVSDREAHFQEVNESRFKELEGALTREGQQKEMAIKELQEERLQWEKERSKLQKALKDTEMKHAEVCGELFTAQQVASLSREKNQEIQAQLDTLSLQADAKKAEQVAETERLRAELYDALASRAEAQQALSAKEARVASLHQDLQHLQNDLETFRGKAVEAETRAKMSAKECQVLSGQIKELESYRNAAVEAESSKDLVQQQKEEIQRLRQESEEYQRQSANLLESMQASQKDMQTLMVELKTLRAADAKLETSQASEMERNAQSAGHTNHRQKIHHIINIKEDNRTLRAELRKARQKIAQLEVASAGEVTSKIGCRLSASPRFSRQTGQSLLDQSTSTDRVAVEHQHLLFLLERASLNSVVAPHQGAAAFLRRLGHLAQDSVDRSSISEGNRGPQTPEKRQSFLEDLSDLGEEVPDASEVDPQINE